MNPLGCWHGAVWEAEVQQAVRGGPLAPMLRGREEQGQLHPRVVTAGDCCPCFREKVEKWAR